MKYNFELYKKSFYVYSKLYADRSQFNRSLKYFYYPTILFMFFTGLFGSIFCVLGLKTYLINLILNKPSKHVSQYIFSLNQLEVSNKINFNKADRLLFNLDNVSVTNGIQIKRVKLLLIALMNGFETGTILWKSHGNSVLLNNTLRLIKLVAIKNIASCHFRKIDLLIQYNDHSPYNLLLASLAKSNRLKIVYIQHAPVSLKFPALYHDLNILFSQDSLDKYMEISNGVMSGEVYIACDLRLPDINTLDGVDESCRDVLICTNKLDDFRQVELCAKQLLRHNYKVALRPHPADPREWAMLGVRISKNTSIWDDLARTKAIVVNESAVVLEALYVGVKVFKLATFSESLDNYSFIKNGLINKEYYELDEFLCDMDKGKETSNYGKLEYYIGDINSREKHIYEIKIILEHMSFESIN